MFVAVLSMMVFGCGGGGEGGGTQTAPPTVAVLTLGTVGTPSASYKGIELTVNLPATVTVKTDPLNPKQTAAGVLKLTGPFAAYSSQVLPRPLWGRYSSAGAGKPSAVMISIASGTANFPVGQFVTMTCDLASVTSVSPSDLSIVNFAAYGTGGATVTGLTASLLAVTLL